ncbi:hematopoietic progenitor cell antigen CD34 [Discoglossus pictus]
MMLFCSLRALDRRQALYGLLSILTLLDSVVANDTSSPVAPSTTTGTQSSKERSSIHPQLPTTSPVKATTKKDQEPTTVLAHITTTAVPQTKDVVTTKDVTTSKTEAANTTSSNTAIDLPNMSTDNVGASNNVTTTSKTLQETEGLTTKPTTATLYTSPESTINISSATSKTMEMSSTQATTMQWECQNLRNLKSTYEVLCVEYKQKVNCKNLTEDQKGILKEVFCKNINDCHVNLSHSEVNPHCLLWIPPMAGVDKKTFQQPSQKWGQVSDHQTKSQKTMIALVTSGVLLAIVIIAGYFLSNRESWSPGRQRLGEDPYYTETDSQGNTLVSVSAHDQDKANCGSRENGTGQAVSPSATNGHKKQGVSDTEL